MKLRDTIAGLFDYERKRKSDDTLEQHLSKLFDALEINCVIDVGANVGKHARMLRNFGYSGRIVSFEPLSEAFAQLELASEGDRDWHTYPLALGREATRLKIHRLNSSDFSSLHEPNTYGRRRFGSRMEVVAEEEVEVTTVARLWPKIVAGVSKPRVFMKMDTQGHDLEVLAGAADVLGDVVAMQSEISFKPIYEDVPNHLEALAEFHRIGFEVTGLYPITRDENSLALIEVDCVTCRSEIERRNFRSTDQRATS